MARTIEVPSGRRRVELAADLGTPKRCERRSLPAAEDRGSVRAIAMPASLVSTLREHRMASRFKDEGDLIFPSEKGTPLDGRNMVRRYFEPALRKAGLPRIRFHDLRHSFASLLIAEGAHPKLISEQLGRASVQITLDRYGHLIDQSYGDASDRLEAALFGDVTRPDQALRPEGRWSRQFRVEKRLPPIPVRRVPR